MADKNNINFDELKKFTDLLLDRIAKDDPVREKSLRDAFDNLGWAENTEPMEEDNDNCVWEYLVIKNAKKEGKIYDIDRLFWDGGKLFGYDTKLNKDGTGSIARIIKDKQPYTVSFRFDWTHCCLLIQCMSLNRETSVPYGTRREIGFDMLFGFKEEVVRPMILRAVEEMMIMVKKMIDDDKEGNRNS